jgi:hypothetical protein
MRRARCPSSFFPHLVEDRGGGRIRFAEAFGKITVDPAVFLFE